MSVSSEAKTDRSLASAIAAVGFLFGWLPFAAAIVALGFGFEKVMTGYYSDDRTKVFAWLLPLAAAIVSFVVCMDTKRVLGSNVGPILVIAIALLTAGWIMILTI